jgi:hypothetical protein
MKKLSVFLILIFIMGMIFATVQPSDASQCYVKIKIKSGIHSVKVDGHHSNLGPGRYLFKCKCMAPIIWIDGQLVPLYPNQRYGGNTYKIIVR